MGPPGGSAVSPLVAALLNLQAQQRTAPGVFALNNEFSPLYTALGLNNLDEFLNGTDGTPGFLEEYGKNILPALTQAQTTANTATRTANLADAQHLAPLYAQTERQANPQAAGLLDTLTGDATRDLSYGTELTPAERTQLTQSVRSGAAARGMGFGPSDLLDEAFADTNEGQALYQQRLGNARTTAGQLQGFYGNPVAAISGMDAGGGITAEQLAGFAGGSTAPTQSGQFNPENAFGQAFMNNATNVSEENAKLRLDAGESLASDVGGLGSGALQGGSL